MDWPILKRCVYCGECFLSLLVSLEDWVTLPGLYDE
jgi:hypothetical protein